MRPPQQEEKNVPEPEPNPARQDDYYKGQVTHSTGPKRGVEGENGLPLESGVWTRGSEGEYRIHQEGAHSVAVTPPHLRSLPSYSGGTLRQGWPWAGLPSFSFSTGDLAGP